MMVVALVGAWLVAGRYSREVASKTFVIVLIVHSTVALLAMSWLVVWGALGPGRLYYRMPATFTCSLALGFLMDYSLPSSRTKPLQIAVPVAFMAFTSLVVLRYCGYRVAAGRVIDLRASSVSPRSSVLRSEAHACGPHERSYKA